MPSERFEQDHLSKTTPVIQKLSVAVEEEQGRLKATREVGRVDYEKKLKTLKKDKKIKSRPSQYKNSTNIKMGWNVLSYFR